MPSAPGYTPANADQRALILSWYLRARSAQLAHARAAARYRTTGLWLGIPSVAIGAVIGSAIFATIDESPSTALKVTAGLLSILAATLSALRIFLSLEDRTREHEVASRAFGAIRRSLGELGAISDRPRQQVTDKLTQVREAYDQTSEATPNIPKRIWESAEYEGYMPGEFKLWPEFVDATPSTDREQRGEE